MSPRLIDGDELRVLCAKNLTPVARAKGGSPLYRTADIEALLKREGVTDRLSVEPSEEFTMLLNRGQPSQS